LETAQHDKHVALIRACKLGDRMAQHALFKAYAKAMLNTSIRIVKDHAQAEDVVQEAFIEVFTRMHLFREDSSFGYWLKQIVVNCSISALRQNKQAQWMNTEDLADSQMLSLYQEDVGYQDEEVAWEIDRIKKAINLLPDGFRMVLVLYLFEGYDHDEIAEILSISAATSRTQFMRGKKKLIDILKNVN
jgi:RNA polymerase sigma factor (sigma-70 family)